MTFTMPADRVVYEEDPVRVRALLALPAEPDAAYVGDPSVVEPSFVPRGDYMDGLVWAGYMPRFYRRQLGIHGDGSGSLVFVHARTPAGGRPRMVIVTLRRAFENRTVAPDVSVPRAGLELIGRSLAADQKFQRRPYSVAALPLVPLGPQQVARFYAGQIDPNDDGRLTIKYEIDGVPGTIEGKLAADSSIALRVLDGPAVITWKPLNP
jgi:hypothetical protein